MSENESEGISDEKLPEDLQPGEDNPLAEPLDDDVEVEDLEMDGGKTPEESDDSEDSHDSGDSDSGDSDSGDSDSDSDSGDGSGDSSDQDG
jgi:hypothetical protein